MAKKVGRNEPCPCESGKKFKKCCLPSFEAIGYRAEVLPGGLVSLVGSLDGSPVPEGGYDDCPICRATTAAEKLKLTREHNGERVH